MFANVIILVYKYEKRKQNVCRSEGYSNKLDKEETNVF